MKRRLPTFLLLIVILACQGQASFEKLVKTGYDNLGSTNVLAEDSSYIMLSLIQDSLTGRQDLGLTRLDDAGGVEAHKVYNVNNIDYWGFIHGRNQFIHATPSTFFLSAIQFLNGKYAVALHKVSRTTLDTLKSAMLTASLFHYTSMSTFIRVNDNKYYLAGIESDGKQSWPYIFVLDSNLAVKSVIQVPDVDIVNTIGLLNPLNKRFVLAGRKTTQVTSMDNFAMIEVDTMGIITKTYTSPPTYSLGIGQMYFSPIDSTIVSVGLLRTYGSGGFSRKRLLIQKFGTDFQLRWRKAYCDEAEYNQLQSAIVLDDGSIVACGARSIPLTFDANGILLKVDRNGNPLWLREYANAGPGDAEIFWDMRKSYDRGFVVVGDNLGPLSKAWVVKTDSLGCVVPNCISYSISINTNLADPPPKPIDTTSTVDLSKTQGDFWTLDPNPASHFVRFNSSDRSKSIDIVILDLNGIICKTTKLTATFLGTGFDVSDLPNGLYFVQDLTGRNVRKLVVHH